MARRTMTGQLNMFDFFSSVNEAEVGEVEIVSLVPNFDEEPVYEDQLLEEPEVIEESEVIEELVSEQIVSEESEIEIEESEVEEFVQPENIPQKQHKMDDQVAMSRSYEKDGSKIEIAYINYNKVRITKENHAPEIKVFASTKEAVDFYVEQMQIFESEDEI